jgi:NTE family protein
MVFHIGALWRLNEAGWLPKLKRISSVSGGSITSALLGLKWPKLGFGADGVAANFVQEVVTPLRKLALSIVTPSAPRVFGSWCTTFGRTSGPDPTASL